MRVVTISAEYGAGGSTVGPAVAERLGVPFLDRAIPVRVAAEIGVSLEESLAHDDRADSGWVSRWLVGAAQMATVGFIAPAAAGAPSALGDDREFVAHTEQVIAAMTSGTGGVVLGRAAAVVLADDADALHVRLHGPLQRRLAQAVRLREIGEDQARSEQAETDRARTAYVKRFYHRDPDDPWLYHLMLDSTALPVDCVVALIVTAAQAA